MTSRLFTDPSDDYALPKKVNLDRDDRPVSFEYWQQVQDRDLDREQELDLDRPRWGEMGREGNDE